MIHCGCGSGPVSRIDGERGGEVILFGILSGTRGGLSGFFFLGGGAAQ